MYPTISEKDLEARKNEIFDEIKSCKLDTDLVGRFMIVMARRVAHLELTLERTCEYLDD